MSKLIRWLGENWFKIAVLIVVLIIGLGYVGYLNRKTTLADDAARRKALTEILEKSDRESKIESCLTMADVQQEVFWESECKGLGRGENCSLPTYNADRVDAEYRRDRDECYKRYQ